MAAMNELQVQQYHVTRWDATEDNGDGTRHPDNRKRALQRIKEYLVENSPVFARLTIIRERGWQNPKGDPFFTRQREQADVPSPKTQKFMKFMMKKIASELGRATDAFTIRDTAWGAGRGRQKRILDCCMAPGSFLQAALDANPRAGALAFTLPPSIGGYNILLADDPARDLTTKLLDVTLLAEDMGLELGDIPADHPDVAAFLPRQVEPGRHFDLALCDGQVLRTHKDHRPAYRERREATRLTLSQLVLGLDHLRPGGTMVVLLHGAEAWPTACLLRTFKGFSTIRVFKPKSAHTLRKTFYMVAKDVRSDDPAAVAAVQGWKEEWRFMTFASEEEYVASRKEDLDVDELLDGFGPELVRLGRSMWKIQAEALEKVSFNQ